MNKRDFCEDVMYSAARSLACVIASSRLTITKAVSMSALSFITPLADR